MSNFELISFTNDAELASAVAAQWLDEIEAANRNGAAHHVALSSGRIAAKFFSTAAQFARERGTRFKSVHFFWGDERCVPPTDAESNFGMAGELLLTPLGVPEARIHRIRGEAPPAEAAAEAEAEICRVAPLNDDGQPVLDLILLGMGEDGHVASLFPGEPEKVAASKAVYRAVTAAKPPPLRITLGYAAIGAARQVWVLASGAGKETALSESVSAAGKTPLARVLRQRASTKIFTDLRLGKKFPALG
jgi:6-phosphogluconolactonase